ncbi:DUF222 domain-containing protein [Trebonia kvetii]|uniref:DUF222 domain-containing protein n=1 Tax=Trebonia kvetii TaxID=2480626 RepID=A0A6P2BNQ7_9ACTN|nr:DUF222 domain-containing protein [Trebonia kvetii]TVZ00590.1 DUF222 domain-containing protein [Trebonia kvetii]
MGPQPGQDDGTGGTPGPGPAPPSPSGFALGGGLDACAVSAALAAAAEAASGAGWRCDGLSRDEMTGLLRRWQALESWAAAGKLGVLRALIRDEDQPLPGGSYRAGLPEGWTRSLTHEVAAALAMSVTSAENLMWLAWDLHARLPATGELLAAGDLTLAKARAIDQALGPLTDEDTAAAEAMIAPELPGKTHSQVARLAEQAAITVDPQSAARRREEAERNRSRVLLFREESGAAGLSGRDLPTGQALAAHARVGERAAEYQDSGVFGEARMDQLRATAYLDLINGTSARSRIACGQLATESRPGAAAGEGPGTANTPPASRQPDTAGSQDPGSAGSQDPDQARGTGLDIGDGDDPDAARGGDRGAADDCGPGGEGPADGRPAGDRPASDGPAGQSSPPRLTDLVLPLATLLGLGERPGEGHGLGPLDPELCRDLAAAAIASPATRLCFTVTDTDGIAIGHGCARPARRQTRQDDFGYSARPGLPARVQLTITASRLKSLAGAVGPPGRSAWRFTCDDDPGPPGGSGRWTLTLPDGRRFAVALEPMPTFDCHHRHESHAYQPNDTLRHLVQVRDGECTFPPCSRHARETDFEHATPYDKGGRTCACNAGSRSRQCHRVKQSPGWNLTQPRPGWHEWTTPTGRSYTQGPKRYPV